MLSATFTCASRLDPALALAAMGAHCACFPARKTLSAFWALLVLSLGADAFWFHLGVGSPLEPVGGLLALPPLCGLGDPYGAWARLPLEQRGGLEALPRFVEWAQALPAPELIAGALTAFNLPLKLVVALFAAGAAWRVTPVAREPYGDV
jgi:hypothetical protein